MNTCRSAFYELRRIRSIRKYLTIDATQTIVCSLVFSRFDCCNSILSGLSKYLIKTAEGSKCSCRENTKDAQNLTYYSSSQNATLVTLASRIAYKIDSICHISLTAAYPKYLLETLNCVYTCKTTVFIIRLEHPQHSYNKDQVIRSANIFIPQTQQLQQSPW